LPVGEGEFLPVIRICEPGPAVFDGSYAPPPIEVLDDAAASVPER
jgi:hypothetical protein